MQEALQTTNAAQVARVGNRSKRKKREEPEVISVDVPREYQTQIWHYLMISRLLEKGKNATDGSDAVSEEVFAEIHNEQGYHKGLRDFVLETQPDKTMILSEDTEKMIKFIAKKIIPFGRGECGTHCQQCIIKKSCPDK